MKNTLELEGSVCREEVGSVYAEYPPILSDYLKILTVGLIDVSTNDTLLSFIYRYVPFAADSFIYITYEELIDSCFANSFNLKQAMNSKISSYYSISSTVDHVQNIIDRFWILGSLQKPFIAIPYYFNYSSSELYDSIPRLTYSYNNKDFPISCLNCTGGTITETESKNNLSWVSLIAINSIWFTGSKVPIVICTAQIDPSVGSQCAVCPPSSSGQIGTGSSSATQNHEIEITLGSQGVMGDDACYSSINAAPLQSISSNVGYAVLSSYGGLPHFTPNNNGLTNEERRIKKVGLPIHDREFNAFSTGTTQHIPANLKEGNILTICQTNTLFNGLGEDIFRYALGHGLYSLTRPGVDQKTVYFAFPYTQGLYFSQGPDMGIFYGTGGQASYCTNGKWEITEDYETEQCEFCNITPQVFNNIASGEVRKYFATTDRTFILNYWSDCVISLGFRSGNALPSGLSGIPGLNLHEFTAVNNPTPCTPPGGSPIVSLSLLSSGDYQIQKKLSTSTTYPNGTVFTVHVRAKFNNGKSIDECRSITLMDFSALQTGSVFDRASVSIRGNIENYSSSVVNYQIDIY